MKYSTHILLVLQILVCPIIAESLPPASTPFRIVLEPTKTHEFQPDPSHSENGKLVYSLTGQVYHDGEGKIIPASASTKKSNPSETLSELLSAYHTKDINKIRALYTPDSATFFEEMISKPENLARWLEIMEKITGASVLMSFDYSGHTIVFAHMDGADFITPLSFTKTGNQFLCCAHLGGDTMLTNLILAFTNYQMKLSEIVKP